MCRIGSTWHTAARGASRGAGDVECLLVHSCAYTWDKARTRGAGRRCDRRTTCGLHALGRRRREGLAAAGSGTSLRIVIIHLDLAIETFAFWLCGTVLPAKRRTSKIDILQNRKERISEKTEYLSSWDTVVVEVVVSGTRVVLAAPMTRHSQKSHPRASCFQMV